MHTNKINNKKYIGITKQKPNSRWRNGKGYRNSNVFYKAIQKYGWDNFEHIILVRNLTEDDACNLEIEYIKKYNTQIPNGYNIDAGGSSGTCFEKPIYMYSTSGEFEKEFESITKAANHIRCDASTISHVITSGNLCKNHFFVYKEDIDMGTIKIRDIVLNYIPYKRTVYQYDFKTHNFIAAYESITDAANKTNTRRTSISSCLSGRNKSTNGYIWSNEKITDFSKYQYVPRKKIDNTRKRNNKKEKMICQYDLKWNYLTTYNSISEAAIKYTGKKHSSTISSALKNHNLTAYGYKWILKENERLVEEYKKDIREDCLYDSVVKEKSKVVNQYSAEGELLNTYISFQSASKQTGIQGSNIRRSALENKNMLAGGYLWRIEGDNTPIVYHGRGFFQKTAIYKFSSDMILLNKYDSVHEAAKMNSLNQSNISACLRRKSKSCGGYIWKYADEVENNVLETAI